MTKEFGLTGAKETTDVDADGQLLILIASNVSEQWGGEPIKAFQMYTTLQALHPETVQITHERVRSELDDRLPDADVHYIADTVVSRLLWTSVVLRSFLDLWFFRKAVKLAEAIAEDRGRVGREVIIHQVGPNSPVTPRSLSRRHINAFGPLNGNIYYPPTFRDAEAPKATWRRRLHRPLQGVNRLRPGGVKRADLIFVAGGERTATSLRAAGCSDAIMVESEDCGIPDGMLDRARIEHHGTNHRFVQFGRLVFHKGTALAIEALAHAAPQATLDIVGQGPELENCQRLARSLGLHDRVRFLPWYASREDLLDSLVQYRAMVLPTLEDANGIVVQEAMALGLPPICLDWGGPQLLIEHEVNGLLIAPGTPAQIAIDLAAAMDRLGDDPAFAEKLSCAGRERAQDWRWTTIARDWLGSYPD